MSNFRFISGNEVFFTSDTHFRHKNIIKYCNRPFLFVEKMNDELVRRWNSKIPNHGTVFHLGDFAFAKKELLDNLIKQLNGRIIFLYGNHDKELRKLLAESPFKDLILGYDYLEIDIQDEEMDLDQKIILNHYPLQEWNFQAHGSWHLHGHSHGLITPNMARIDVGVDLHNFTPLSYQEIKELMTAKIFKNANNIGSIK